MQQIHSECTGLEHISKIMLIPSLSISADGAIQLTKTLLSAYTLAL